MRDYPTKLLRIIRKLLEKLVSRLTEKFNPTTPSLRYFGYLDVFLYSTAIASYQLLMVLLKEFIFFRHLTLNWLGETVNRGDYVFFRLNSGQVLAIHDFQVKNHDKLGNIWIHGQHVSRCKNSFDQTDNSNLKAKLTFRTDAMIA